MRLTALICLLLTFSQALSYEVSESGKQYIDDFQLYEDTSSRYKVDEISSLQAANWASLSIPSINLGYRSSTIWLKFTLNNLSNTSITRLFDITYPLLDFVSLYEQKQGQKEFSLIMDSGDGRPFDSRNIDHPNFVNIITIAPDETNTYLVSIRSNAPIQSEFILWDFDEFQEHYRSITSLNFFYLGLILFAAAFNFFIYFYLKETVYLVYGFYAVFFALLITSQNAILFEHLFSSAPEAHNWSQAIFACATLSLTALFNFHFLKLKIETSGSKALMAFTIIPLLLLVIGPLFGYPTTIKTAVLLTLTLVPACFIIGIFNSKNSKDRHYYILAWSWLILGVTVFALAKIGVLPFNSLTNNAIVIGSTLELLTFAAALGKRIHTEKETRIKAQQIVIEGTRHSAELQKELLYRATHNTITGLPNKSYFESWLNGKLKTKPNGFLVLIKLSRISEIEKTLGTTFAEDALETFSTKLNSEILNLSGAQYIEALEDFAVATIDSSSHAFYIHPADQEIFLKEMASIVERLNKPLTISNMEVEPYLRVAYVNHTDKADFAGHLLRQGAIALEQATNTQSISQYKSEDDQYSEKRLNLMKELKEAITDNNLSLDFQPLVDTKSGKFLGAEALIRWPHKEHGLIMPDQFIEIAERTGVIQSLSLWVIKNAIKSLKSWHEIRPNFMLAINISANNLQDKKFMDAVHFLFHEHQELAGNIILEITETQMMTDTKSALKNLWLLSEMGFHIAIDDFGTGYSNLAYLKKLPASELKIDKSFILNLESDKQNQVLVHTAIEMAHNLGLKVVAEGVESEKSRILLEEMGCDMCQGFHISKPMPKEQFEALLKAH